MTVDPVTQMMALLIGARHSKRHALPPTPEQIAQAKANAERDKWNRDVAARRAEKKPNKGKP